jgi:hypothetical protein
MRSELLDLAAFLTMTASGLTWIIALLQIVDGGSPMWAWVLLTVSIPVCIASGKVALTDPVEPPSQAEEAP